ncbi:MAG: 30S ribosomal protein S3 [Magnetococcales bacterium]|nr:30S ribosomal protein S3 [Magnetococcales bacterium]
MGQKVHPTGFRLGNTKTWDTRWYADKAFGPQLVEDVKLRAWLKKRLEHASVSRIVIERPAKMARINIHSARPGIIIGKKGTDIEKLKNDIRREVKTEVQINIVEVRKPEAEAQLIAENVAQQLVRRVAFRRSMKRAVTSAMRLGAKGIRINCAGRLGGGEIARTEWYREGRVPLHTLRADIDFGFAQAKTTYGIIGVKVWVYKGEVTDKEPH